MGFFCVDRFARLGVQGKEQRKEVRQSAEENLPAEWSEKGPLEKRQA